MGRPIPILLRGRACMSCAFTMLLAHPSSLYYTFNRPEVMKVLSSKSCLRMPDYSSAIWHNETHFLKLDAN